MGLKRIFLIIVSIILLLFVIFGISIALNFNKAVRAKNDVLEKRAQINNALELRFDKLEALLNALEGLSEHVETQLDKITSARANLNTASPDELAEEVDDIFSGINQIIVIIEDNPDTYIATSAYMSYMGEISATNNLIFTTRSNYNTAITAYNNHLETFPRNIYLKWFSFNKYELYEQKVNIE